MLSRFAVCNGDDQSHFGCKICSILLIRSPTTMLRKGVVLLACTLLSWCFHLSNGDAAMLCSNISKQFRSICPITLVQFAPWKNKKKPRGKWSSKHYPNDHVWTFWKVATIERKKKCFHSHKVSKANEKKIIHTSFTVFFFFNRKRCTKA